METGARHPGGSLRRDPRRYNRHAADKQDPLPQAPRLARAAGHRPWGAFDLTLGKALYAGFTIGGLRCSVDGEVERADGSTVAGLYAAGACASNIAQDGKGYASAAPSSAKAPSSAVAPDGTPPDAEPGSLCS